VKLVKKFRLDEMCVTPRILHIRAGLSTIVPWNEIQTLFGENDLELKVCGQSKIDLDLLKKYTIYQVGLSSEDPHIKIFWTVLENFDAQQRQRFVKFACNQVRP